MNRHVTRRLLVRLGSAILVWSSFGMVSEAGEDGVRRLSVAAMAPAEIEKSLYFYSEDMTLGNAAPARTIEATVRLGKQHVTNLQVPPGRGIDPEHWSLHLIEVPFTLEKAPGEKAYKQVVFRVALTDPTATAYDLFPPSVTEERKTTLKFGLDPKLKFQWADIGTQLTYETEFEVLVPRITLYDVGRSEFRWEYEGTYSAPVLPGTRYALIILEVPKELAEVRGEVSFEATVLTGRFDLLREVTTYTSKLPVVWSFQ